MDNPLLILLMVLLLFITGCILAGAMVWQGYKVTEEKFSNIERNITVVVVAAVVGLAIYRPFGIINFKQFESKDLLIAEREGGGNCTITVKLKEDKTFRERDVCFGVIKTEGQYAIRNDTITFSDIESSNDKDFYKFAVIKPSDSLSGGHIGDLVLYRGPKDTTPFRLWITKNELIPN